MTLVTIALLAATPGAGAVDFPLHGHTVVGLATVPEGRRLISLPDAFTAALSPTDLAYRLKTRKPTTAADLLAYAADQVRPFSATETKKLEAIIGRVRARLTGFKLPLPEEIFIVKTTGLEEGGAAYCRRNAIIFPESVLGRSDERLERLLIHELFHVLSNQNEPLRRALYAVIGFRACPPIDLPRSLADRKLTNPDGPTLEYCITLETPAGERVAVPFLSARIPFDPEQPNRSFFEVLEFRLLAVEPAGDHWRPVTENDTPILLDPAVTPSYARQIGGNTGYIIHPDEILAENFVALVLGTKDLTTPRIPASIAQILREYPPTPPIH